MFSVIKVREGLARGDYADPGPYKHPAGTIAYEYTGPVSDPARRVTPESGKPATEFNVIKPGTQGPGYHDH
jgi:hypothetical protein